MQPEEPKTSAHGEGAETSGTARGNSPGASDATPRAGDGAPPLVGARASRGAWRVVVTVAVLGAVWWPARPGGRDGFPLSSYPMFGYARPPTSEIDTVLGVGADGQRRPLSPELLAGVSQPKLALERVRDAIRRERAGALCRDVAQRVKQRAASGQRADERLVALEVVTDTWDTLAGLEPGAQPRTRIVHERCEVPG